MENPWETSDLDIYESHMNLKNVAQIPLLNKIMKSQLSLDNIDFVAIWGVAGGNGLEYISCNDFKKVYCVDINIKYLDVIEKRYSYLNCLILEKLDLNDISLNLPEVNLVIANLLLEYIGLNNFTSQIKKIKPKYVSCVIQIDDNLNDKNNFVVDSIYSDSLKNISKLGVSIDKNDLISKMNEIEYKCILEEKYDLPSNKKFIRLDFSNLI